MSNLFDPDYCPKETFLKPNCKHKSTAIRDMKYDKSGEPTKCQEVCTICGKVLGWAEMLKDSSESEIAILKDKLHRRNMQIKELKSQVKNLEEKVSKIQHFDNNFHELDNIDLQELGHQITEGFTSGRLDNEKQHCYWDLRVNVWKE